MRAYYSTIRLIEAGFVVGCKSFLNSGTYLNSSSYINSAEGMSAAATPAIEPAKRWLHENNLGDGVDLAPYTGDLDDLQCSI